MAWHVCQYFLPQSGKLARCGLLLLLSSAYVKLYQFLCVHDHVSTMLSPCGSHLRARNEFFSHHLHLDLCTLSVLTVKPLKHGECSLCLHGRKWTTISLLSWWGPYQIWKPDSMGIWYYLCAIKALPLLLAKHWYNSIKSTRSSDWHDLRIHQNTHMHT